MTTNVGAPFNIETEQALLGAILNNSEAFAYALPLVQADDFSEEIHRRVFDVMGQLVQAGRPITFHGLMAFLGDHELDAGVSTKAYLARLAAAAVAILPAPEYARLVRDAAARRKLIAAGEDLALRARDARVDVTPEQVASDSLEAIRLCLDHASSERTRFALGAGAARLVDTVEGIRRGEIKSNGIRTGFADLDRLLGGLRPGTILVVAARVAMGKTLLMTNFADGIARRNEGIGVLEFSLEVPEEEITARHLAAAVFDRRDPIPFSAIQFAKGLTNRQVERLVDAQRELANLPIIIECPPRISAAELVGRIAVERRAMATRGIRLGVVLIDYLDKIAATDRYAGQRTYEIQDIVTTLKAAARAEGVCIVLLAQLNRGTESRDDKRPSLADLKSSSFLEQEAHAVIFVYREAYYLQKSPEYREGQEEARSRLDIVRHEVELIIGKNRSGPENVVPLWGDVACSYLASSAP